jgi:hypothetical protein
MTDGHICRQRQGTEIAKKMKDCRNILTVERSWKALSDGT